MTLASIVVPSRAGAARLPLLIASLRAQTEKSVEMIVVIDGDVDDSESVVRRAGRDYRYVRSCFPRTEAARQRSTPASSTAEGDVLIRADDDLELEPDFVEHHVRLHEEAPRGVIAMCRDVFPDTPYARAYGIEADEAIRAAAFATPPERTWQWWSGNVSTTADDFHRVGGYDEDFRAYGWEDIEWGYRLHLLGRDILIAPDFSTLHHGPVTSTVERLERAYASGAAYAKFVQKHGDVWPSGAAERSAWNALVTGASRLGTARSVSVTGRSLDRVVDQMPHYVAHKLVALSLQASARAGRQRLGR